MLKKILFVGRPAMGKTTIINIIFKDENPYDLVLFPLESTLGTKYSSYDLLDLKISILDTAGQSISTYLNNEEQQDIIFRDTSVLIYIFDYNIWINTPDEIIEDINKIYEIKEKNNYIDNLFLFFHKIDLIPQLDGEKLNSLEIEVNQQLNLSEKLPVYFTSIHPDYIYSLYYAFYNSLSNISNIISNFNKIISESIRKESSSICFIINNKNHIINQAVTDDFNIKLVQNFHNILSHHLKSAENNLKLETFPKIIEINSIFFYNNFKEISDINKDFNSIIMFSEKLNSESIEMILNNIYEKIKQYFINN